MPQYSNPCKDEDYFGSCPIMNGWVIWKVKLDGRIKMSLVEAIKLELTEELLTFVPIGFLGATLTEEESSASDEVNVCLYYHPNRAEGNDYIAKALRENGVRNNGLTGPEFALQVLLVRYEFEKLFDTRNDGEILCRPKDNLTMELFNGRVPNEAIEASIAVSHGKSQTIIVTLSFRSDNTPDFINSDAKKEKTTVTTEIPHTAMSYEALNTLRDNLRRLVPPGQKSLIDLF